MIPTELDSDFILEPSAENGSWISKVGDWAIISLNEDTDAASSTNL